MDGFMEHIDNLTDTKGLEEFLHIAIYCVAVIVIIIFVFYVCIKINNFIQRKRSGKKKKDRDDYLA